VSFLERAPGASVSNSRQPVGGLAKHSSAKLNLVKAYVFAWWPVEQEMGS
jgi:hypothetical protein